MVQAVAGRPGREGRQHQEPDGNLNTENGSDLRVGVRNLCFWYQRSDVPGLC